MNRRRFFLWFWLMVIVALQVAYHLVYQYWWLAFLSGVPLGVIISNWALNARIRRAQRVLQKSG